MPRISAINFLANVEGNSWVHRLDPRTKIALLVFFTTIPLLFTDIRFVLFFILLTVPLWLTSRISLRPMIGPLSAVGVFLVTIFLLNALRGPSELTAPDPRWSVTWHYQLGPIVVTSHSFVRGLWLALRLAVPMTFGLLVISTTEPVYLAKGLRKLGMPIWTVFMVLSGLRFLPIVMEQLFNIMDAMTMRGVGDSRIEQTRLLVMPLFISSLRRTRTLGLSCEAKGFGANQWNNFYEEMRIGPVDKAIIAGVGILAAVSLVARFGLGLGSTGESFSAF
jgi:energy-coupling factor transport system permease protein